MYCSSIHIHSLVTCFIVFLKMSHVICIVHVSVSVSCGMCFTAIFHTECREAGEPVAYECVQDERAGLWRPAEDGGEGAERRPPACSSLSVKGQNGGQRHTGHPRARSCKEPNRFSSTLFFLNTLQCLQCSWYWWATVHLRSDVVVDSNQFILRSD